MTVGLELSGVKEGVKIQDCRRLLLRLLAAVPRAAVCPSSSHKTETGEKRVAWRNRHWELDVGAGEVECSGLTLRMEDSGETSHTG